MCIHIYPPNEPNVRDPELSGTCPSATYNLACCSLLFPEIFTVGKKHFYACQAHMRIPTFSGTGIHPSPNGNHAPRCLFEHGRGIASKLGCPDAVGMSSKHSLPLVNMGLSKHRGSKVAWPCATSLPRRIEPLRAPVIPRAVLNYNLVAGMGVPLGHRRKEFSHNHGRVP